jgi:ppGpp synthetase/RelA/SpoT-type nucleotidyltranferase
VRIPGSFIVSYREQEATAKRLQRIAGKRLRLMCNSNQWLFDDRVKGEESAFAKLQLGGFKRISDVHDFYAATVVIPTPAELSKAVSAMKASFGTTKVVKRTVGDPRTFSYDDLHILVTLGKNAPGEPTAVKDRVFEVQVRTGLQYAWWRATHDTVYKGGEKSWRLGRVASQVRASLELLDIVLADLRKAARLLTEKKTSEDKAFAAVVQSLNRWPEERRPTDVLGFFNAIGEIARATDTTEQTVVAVLNAAEGKRLTGETEVTPLQAVLGALIERDGPEVVDKLKPKRYVLLNTEFLAACPAAEGVASLRRVVL